MKKNTIYLIFSVTLVVALLLFVFTNLVNASGSQIVIPAPNNTTSNSIDNNSVEGSEGDLNANVVNNTANNTTGNTNLNIENTSVNRLVNNTNVDTSVQTGEFDTYFIIGAFAVIVVIGLTSFIKYKRDEI